VELHAQDLLSSSHVEPSRASAITLKAFSMFRTDLTDRPCRQKGGYRRGIYLDDVVARVVSRLLSELILHNSMTMMLILSSVAASNTTTAASSAVSSAGSMASLGATHSSILISEATANLSARANKVGRTASDTAKVAANKVSELAMHATFKSKFKVFSTVGKLIKPGIGT